MFVQEGILVSAVAAGTTIRVLRSLLFPGATRCVLNDQADDQFDDPGPVLQPLIPLPPPPGFELPPPWERTPSACVAEAAGALLGLGFLLCFKMLCSRRASAHAVSITRHSGWVDLSSASSASHSVLHLPAARIQPFAQDCLSYMLMDDAVSACAVLRNL